MRDKQAWTMGLICVCFLYTIAKCLFWVKSLRGPKNVYNEMELKKGEFLQWLEQEQKHILKVFSELPKSLRVFQSLSMMDDRR